jgi:hypothetical protein
VRNLSLERTLVIGMLKIQTPVTAYISNIIQNIEYAKPAYCIILLKLCVHDKCCGFKVRVKRGVEIYRGYIFKNFVS